MIGVVHQRNFIIEIRVFDATILAADSLIERDVRNMPGCSQSLELFVEMTLIPCTMFADQIGLVPCDGVRFQPWQWSIILRHRPKENDPDPVLLGPINGLGQPI